MEVGGVDLRCHQLPCDVRRLDLQIVRIDLTGLKLAVHVGGVHVQARGIDLTSHQLPGDVGRLDLEIVRVYLRRRQLPDNVRRVDVQSLRRHELPYD